MTIMTYIPLCYREQPSSLAAMTNDKISMYVSRENEIRSIHETVSFGSMHIIKMHQN